MKNDSEIAERAARAFIERETQFHLGFLPTEQSNPKTRDFSATVCRDSAAGAAMLLSVDLEIPLVAAKSFESRQFAALERALVDCAASGGTLCFSGCGATGRLAIILEKMWRAFWEEAAAHNPAQRMRFRELADHSLSIMTGGDRALIRSVENFEDYTSFGRRQVADSRLGRGDVLIAISEGGETSSVIGTALEASERGARVFFVYNNPTVILAEHVARSRAVIDEPSIVKIDLSTGPMALSGSTRLQATTVEMLVVGAALERTAARLFSDIPPAQGAPPAVFAPALEAPSYADLFDSLVRQLASGVALDGLAAAVDLESEVYREGGLVTYLCDEYLLDIISDTTERTPTFMLPPFRRSSDEASPQSWAFAKDPLRATPQAWRQMLLREPRGIEWSAADYAAMGASSAICARPPKLDNEEILSYQIGAEADPSRAAPPGSLLLLVSLASAPTPAVYRFFADSAKGYPRAATLDIAPHVPDGRRTEGQLRNAQDLAGRPASSIAVPLDLPSTPMRLFAHLAMKLLFNTLSTASMGKLGRTQGNWMIQVDPTNKKLIDRATRIIASLAGIPYDQACIELFLTRATARGEEPNQSSDSCVVTTLKRLGVFSERTAIS